MTEYEKLWKDLKLKLLSEIDNGNNSLGLSHVFRLMGRMDGTVKHITEGKKAIKPKKPPKKTTEKETRTKEKMKEEIMSIYEDDEE